MKILNKILKTIYDPDEQSGKFAGTGSKMTGETNPEPNGYESNANTAGEVNTGQDKPIDTGYGIERDIQDWHTTATQDLLGNPQSIRPSKNSYRNIDRQLENQYFNNLEQR